MMTNAHPRPNINDCYRKSGSYFCVWMWYLLHFNYHLALSVGWCGDEGADSKRLETLRPCRVPGFQAHKLWHWDRLYDVCVSVCVCPRESGCVHHPWGHRVEVWLWLYTPKWSDCNLNWLYIGELPLRWKVYNMYTTCIQMYVSAFHISFFHFRTPTENGQEALM